MEAIKDIGNLLYESMEGDNKLLKIFTEDVSSGLKYNKILEIILKLDKDEIKFKEINYREYDDELKFKYLYRAGSSRGADLTPTAKITEVEKTYKNKIIKSIKEGIEDCKDDNEKKLLDAILEELSNSENEGKIIEQIKSKYNSIPKKERYVILTLVIEEDSTNKYIGDFKVFKERITKIPIKKFYYSQTNNKEVKGKEEFCSICNERKKEVFGLASPFTFYTIDKPGYISGGFNYGNAWKNYPVCKECAIKLELGADYIRKKLTMSFYGRKFYLIPKTIYARNLEGILRKYSNRLDNDENKKVYQTTHTEDIIFRKLCRENNNVTFDLMFIEENNAALNILLNVEDIHPSTFKKLYDRWDDIKSMEFFSKIKYMANFGYLNDLFDSKNYNRYFLETVDNIIGKGKIEYNFLIKFINDKLTEAFKNEDDYYEATFKAYIFMYYLYSLDKFRNRGREGVKEMNREIWGIKDFNNKKEAFEDFFNSNKAFFNSDSKKAIFMIGYLSKMILNIQYRKEEGRKPFMNNLNGLKINKRDILRLLPKIQGKLIEYKAEYYNEELEITSEYLIMSNELEEVSNLDIPLYFSLGMNMSKKFDFAKGDGN